MSENPSKNGVLVKVDGVEKVFHRGEEEIHVLAEAHLEVPHGEVQEWCGAHLDLDHLPEICLRFVDNGGVGGNISTSVYIEIVIAQVF